MHLIAIQPLGHKHETRRLWIESQRLAHLGFAPGVPFKIDSHPESLTLRPAILAENHVSSRKLPEGRRPIIDLANQSLLSGFADYSEVKILASFERIQVTPSRRALAIHKSRHLNPPFRVLEVFAGGGTMTAALADIATFQVVGGVEIEPDFADEWQAAHREAALFQCDVRSLQVADLPEFDALIGGLPCTCHSNLGRAKKRLAGKPETGDTGDLFVPVLTLISERMPAVVVLENVPAFGGSLAGQLVVTHLERIGYHVSVSILRPNDEWGEIEDRRRWLMVATLDRPFVLRTPAKPCSVPVAAFLDPPNPEQDSADARRIAVTIEGLRAHNARHQTAGHGFSFTVVTGEETRLPTIVKSYHKINTGPFVQTPFGPRLLRLPEIERIHGCNLRTRHYATAVQILGQGVQTCIFRNVFEQIADHLCRKSL